MTIALGARCKDGVAIVADRRMVRQGGLEISTPDVKLRQIGGVIFARVGIQPFYDALERVLFEEDAVTCWDVGDTIDALVERYQAFRDDSPVFPLAMVSYGQANLYQMTAGFPPAKVLYQVWGIAEEYGAMGRLFPWEETPVDVAWKVLVLFVRASARASVAVGDGVDSALIRDNGTIEFVDDTTSVWEEAEGVIDQMVALFRMRMEVPEVTEWIE
ncbi:MAG: hypothetical protein JSW38_13095, partial [Dehalococcoidia bacterium]